MLSGRIQPNVVDSIVLHVSTFPNKDYSDKPNDNTGQVCIPSSVVVMVIYIFIVQLAVFDIFKRTVCRWFSQTCRYPPEQRF